MKSVSTEALLGNWEKTIQKYSGQEVAIIEKGNVVAYLRVMRKVQIPDFRKRIVKRFGNRTLSRQDSLWLDEAKRSRY